MGDRPRRLGEDWEPKNEKNLLAALVAPLILTACITPVPYVDPKYDAAPVTLPDEVADMQTSLNVEFYRNGKRAKSVDKPIRKIVVTALENRGVEISDAAPTTVDIALDNIADTGDAAASGFGTGLTLGLAGSAVTDFYKATVKISDGSIAFAQTYDHAVYTTIGRVKAPPIANVKPQSNLQNAISAVIGDIVDQALFDYATAKSVQEAAAPAEIAATDSGS